MICEHYYLSEDVASGARAYGKSDDVFTIGVVLHELATMATPDKPEYTAVYDDSGEKGTPLFSNKDLEAGAYHKIGGEVSAKVHNLLEAILQPDPNKRPTAAELLHFPGVSKAIQELVQSEEFNRQFEEGVKRWLSFGWASQT